MSTKRHAATGFIFVTIVLDMLAFGIAAPTLPKLISDFLGGNTARASEYLGFFITTFALMQFFFSPVLGMLSDRVMAVPELAGEHAMLYAREGFNIIATANTRDRGVNEMSAALKRRFNFETVEPIRDLEMDRSVKTLKPFDFHEVRIDRSSMRVLVGLVAIELKHGFVNDG